MYWGVIVAALASFFFGWLFYSKALFGNLWMKYCKVDKKKAKEMAAQPMAGRMFISFIANIVTAWVIWMFMNALLVTGASGIFSMVWRVWLGFMVSATLLNGTLWGNKPVGLFFLDSLYWFLNLGIMAFVLNAF